MFLRVGILKLLVAIDYFQWKLANCQLEFDNFQWKFCFCHWNFKISIQQ